MHSAVYMAEGQRPCLFLFGFSYPDFTKTLAIRCHFVAIPSPICLMTFLFQLPSLFRHWVVFDSLQSHGL